jgi:ATP-dependent DNA helicase RecQ
MDEARDILRERFGYADFRAGQDALIEQLLSGRDCLGVMPTGAGKSLCYQVPALIFEGLTIVISPLISLMKDQVDALRSNGIEADCLNSSLSSAQRSAVLKRVAQGICRILYVAPERLGAPEFVRLIAQTTVALVAVDEAHCVSQWGHDFRPSYRDIPRFIDELSPRPVVGCYTATATQRVRTDVEQLLRLRDPFVLVTGFDRANLHFSVKRPRDKTDTLLSFIQEQGEASGIVYCTTRRTVEELCEELCDDGIAATRYHDGLDEKERRVNQDDFLYDRRVVMVATNAFGMGIDKSNVGYVVHYNMPLNLESYYQEAGRAGRDGSPATCLLLYEPADVQTNTFLITHSDEGRSFGGGAGGRGAGGTDPGGFGSVDPSGFGGGASGRAPIPAAPADPAPADPVAREARISNDLALLRQMTFYATTNDCLRGFILRYFGEAAPVFCGDCSNCLTSFESLDVTVEAQKIISCVYRLRERGRRLGKSLITDILRGSRNKRILEQGLDTLSTYGIMADCSTARLRALLDILIEKGYLGLTETEYPVVFFSERSRALLGNVASFIVKLPKEKPSAEKGEQGGRGSASTRKRRGIGTAFDEEADVDPRLFERLRELRSRIAHEEGMPAYIVFADAALREMAARKPQNPDEFLQISGVGTVKLERYGTDFLACIQEYLAPSDSLSTPSNPSAPQVEPPAAQSFGAPLS